MLIVNSVENSFALFNQCTWNDVVKLSIINFCNFLLLILLLVVLVYSLFEYFLIITPTLLPKRRWPWPYSHHWHPLTSVVLHQDRQISCTCKQKVRYHVPVNKSQIACTCKMKVRYHVSATRKSDIMYRREIACNLTVR